MAIPPGVTKYVVSGTMPSGEIWQTAWWRTGLAATDVTDAAAATVATGAPLTAVLNAWKAWNGTQVKATALDMYHYGSGTGADAHGHASLAVAGTQASNISPNQVALVVTLRSATATRSGRGRQYWPATGMAISAADGLFPSGSVSTFLTALAALFLPPTSPQPTVVVSQTRIATYPVVSIDADTRPDTQRRRLNSIRVPRQSVSL